MRLWNRLSLLDAVLDFAPANIRVPLPNEEDVREEIHQADHLVPFNESRIVPSFDTLTDGAFNHFHVEKFGEERPLDARVGERSISTFSRPFDKLSKPIVFVIVY